MRKRLCLMLALLALPTISGGQPADRELIAVLEFLNPDQIVSDSEATSITDMVRITAGDLLPANLYHLMTQENIDELLPKGVKLADCTEGSCEVEIGKKLGARYMMTGSITNFRGELRIFIKLYDVRSSSLIKGKWLTGRNAKELDKSIQESTRELLLLLPGVSGTEVSVPSGGAVFVSPAQPATPSGAAEVRALAPTEQPPATATGPASLYITSNPPGAEVYLGATKAGNTSPAFQMPNLQAGTSVRVTLKLNLYHDVSFDVDLKPGITKFENVEIKPAFGGLVIESEPSGAKVLIGGSEVGTTPYNNPRYPSGDYLVGLELDQYAPISGQTLTVKDGETTKKSFTLSANFGTLEVASNPSGAEVSLDGKKLGSTPGTWRVAPVAQGKVQVARTGYRSREFEIKIDRGQTVKITAEQATLVAKVGSLQVFADPPEAGTKVFVDGKEVGTAPATINDLIEGAHEVKVETQDKAGTTKVNIQEGQTAVATVKLESRGASGFVRIPAGTFMMGSPSNESDRDDDETQHTVTISRPFLLGTTEVTQGQWKTVMGNNPSHFSSCGDDCPVENVSWHHVIEFCNKLSDKEGLIRCYSGNWDNITWDRNCTGYRLPTEAEWEYAARAGTASRFACGNSDLCSSNMGWRSGNSGSQTHAVGQKQANAWGLYDMHGNVYEWVWDCYGDYLSGSVTDPEGPGGGSLRVFRGGSWPDGAKHCRSANRDYHVSGNHFSVVGFRLARSLP